MNSKWVRERVLLLSNSHFLLLDLNRPSDIHNPYPPTISTALINDVPMLDSKLSYKNVISNQLLSTNSPLESPLLQEDDNLLEKDLVNLSVEERTRPYDPWKYLIIIKTVWKKFTHQYLKIKLEALWKPSRPICLIDLGSDFYMVKFDDLESQAESLQGGPWFIAGTFLFVRKWEPNFVPSAAQIDSTAICVRLP